MTWQPLIEFGMSVAQLEELYCFNRGIYLHGGLAQPPICLLTERELYHIPLQTIVYPYFTPSRRSRVRHCTTSRCVLRNEVTYFVGFMRHQDTSHIEGICNCRMGIILSTTTWYLHAMYVGPLSVGARMSSWYISIYQTRTFIHG